MIEEYIEKAKSIVTHHIEDELGKNDEGSREFVLYLENFFVLKGSWKALFRSSTSNQRYYELTYDKDRRETIVRNLDVVRSHRVTDRMYNSSNESNWESP